jgi:hypothetical protein
MSNIEISAGVLTTPRQARKETTMSATEFAITLDCANAAAEVDRVVPGAGRARQAGVPQLRIGR